MIGNPPTPKNWTAPGPADESNSLPQTFTEQFQVPAVPGVPTSTQQTIHHHHHHHVHHHFHHYHHYPGNGDQWRQLEQQSEAEAMQAHLQNENGPQNTG
jgi:Myb-like DNA-binding protein BAS1